MKNRFNLNEEEKKHIRGLHNINEQVVGYGEQGLGEDAGMDTPGGNPDYFYDEDSLFAKEKGFPDNLENMLNNLSQQDGMEMSKEDIVNELIGIYSYSQDGATDLVNTALESLITNLGGFKDNINEESDINEQRASDEYTGLRDIWNDDKYGTMKDLYPNEKDFATGINYPMYKGITKWDEIVDKAKNESGDRVSISLPTMRFARYIVDNFS